ARLVRKCLGLVGFLEVFVLVLALQLVLVVLRTTGRAERLVTLSLDVALGLVAHVLAAFWLLLPRLFLPAFGHRRILQPSAEPAARRLVRYRRPMQERDPTTGRVSPRGCNRGDERRGRRFYNPEAGAAGRGARAARRGGMRPARTRLG